MVLMKTRRVAYLFSDNIFFFLIRIYFKLHSGAAAARLPSAATCMNLLKLPQYESVQQLKEKLLYAIKSHSGFELS